jgi:hypothetical protein
MKVGDLIQDSEYGDIGLILQVDRRRERNQLHPETHLVLACRDSRPVWLEEEYLQKRCEVISEDY